MSTGHLLFDELTYHVFGELPYDGLEYNRACDRHEHEAEVEIECIPLVRFIIDSNRVPKNFLPEERAAKRKTILVQGPIRMH